MAQKETTYNLMYIMKNLPYFIMFYHMLERVLRTCLKLIFGTTRIQFVKPEFNDIIYGQNRIFIHSKGKMSS